MKYGWKGHKDRNRHKNRIKRSGQGRLVYVYTVTSRPREGEPVGTLSWGCSSVWVCFQRIARGSAVVKWHCVFAVGEFEVRLFLQSLHVWREICSSKRVLTLQWQISNCCRDRQWYWQSLPQIQCCSCNISSLEMYTFTSAAENSNNNNKNP